MVGLTNTQNLGSAQEASERKTPLQIKLVERVYAMLSAEERLALVLHHTRRLKPSEMARQLQLPRAAALAVLAQAESKVRTAQRALIEAIIEVKLPAAPKKSARVRTARDEPSVQVARA